MNSRILIVDDEADLAATIEFNMQRERFSTRVALTGRSAVELLGAEVPDLVILDLMLPDMSGLDVCRHIRADDRLRRIAILMLSARGDEIDRVVGFEVGADDYMVKPFSMRELSLRVQAILRRKQDGQSKAPTDRPEERNIRFGRLHLDFDAHRAWVDEQDVKLTALEFRLLSMLAQRRGRVQTRESLLSDVWGLSNDVVTRTIDTHVKRLREKLGPAAEYVETIRGVGYRFIATPPEQM